MKQPIILDLTESQVKTIHDSHKKNQEALAESNGQNLFAAAGADPGIISCPYCSEYHWKIGKLHKCTACSGIYPVNWWSMYVYGARFNKEHKVIGGLLKSTIAE